jgi:exopolysaccharide production protein ExoQ
MNNKLLNFLEYGFGVGSLLVYAGGIIVLVISGGQQEYEEVTYDNSLIRIAYFSIYIITIILLSVRWRKTVQALRQNYWVFSLVLIAIISFFWSFEKSNTLKDSFTIIGSSLFGLYLGSRYTLRQQLELMSWTFGIIIVLSFVFAIAIPKLGIMGASHQGKWRGVFSHKNGLGQSMVYSFLVFMFLNYQNRKHKLTMWIGMSLSMLLLLLSASTSSLFNLFILVCIFFVTYLVRLPYLLMFPVVALIATIGEFFYIWSIDNYGTIFNSVGKDATLTGRTELWQLATEMIWKEPWIGYGFGGFWQGLNGTGSGYILRALSWTPSHPHNGYLQLLLDLGILGLSIFFIGLAITLIRSLNYVRSTKEVASLWSIVHIAQLLITSTTESQLFVSNNIGWILYVAISFSLQPRSLETLRSSAISDKQEMGC